MMPGTSLELDTDQVRASNTPATGYLELTICLTGFVGMNNIKANDYVNVVAQLMAHVLPIRNFFLLHEFPTPGTPEMVLRFRTLVRKLWNPKAFRSHVSPHELLQEIALRSSKRFTLTNQSDPVEFLSWFLNALHLSLGGSKKPSPTPTSVIHAAFQGHLRIESQAITAHSDTQNARLVFTESGTINSQVTPFLILTLDLPPTPLFQSANRESIIPQIPLTTLLNKYNGYTASEKLAHRVRHRLLHPLPPYLFFHIKRFSKNRFVSERNPTIVTFPSPVLWTCHHTSSPTPRSGHLASQSFTISWQTSSSTQLSAHQVQPMTPSTRASVLHRVPVVHPAVPAAAARKSRGWSSSTTRPCRRRTCAPKTAVPRSSSSVDRNGSRSRTCLLSVQRARHCLHARVT